MAEGGIELSVSESGYCSLYSRHSLSYVQSVSVEISSIMTRLRYGEEIRRWRVEKYNEIDRVANLRGSKANVTQITAGSKAEGLTRYYESDKDLLLVLNGVLCLEAGSNLHSIPDDMDVFRMDTHVYPGHCKLMQERPAHARRIVIRDAMCDNGYGEALLSSSLFLDECALLRQKRSMFRRVPVVEHDRAGPSLPRSFDGLRHLDRVYALHCHCPSILQRWAARPRHWPSSVIVQRVVSLGAYLTPVGCKGSEYAHIEWRICFNTGLTELVNNLNDTQAKVYVLLKMILKDIIKPKNKEITSFMLKTIILWQAENIRQTKFHARSLLHWLHEGLRQLRTAIEKKQLRYFMIPEKI